IAAAPTGNTVNPNYASRIVLQSIPDMTPDLLASILAMRQQSIFTSREDFRSRTGLAADSALLNHFAFDRGTAPAILTVARLHNSALLVTERRTRMQIVDPRRKGVAIRFVGLIERSVPVE